jgi:hypothetical protein
VDDLHERAGSKNVAFAWRIIESEVQKTNHFD